MQQEVKKYKTPRLERFGHLSDLTAGGSGAKSETIPTGMNRTRQRL